MDMVSHDDILEDIKEEARSIRDGEVKEYEKSKVLWKSSEFGWIRDIGLPSQRGKIFTKFLLKLISHGGFRSVREENKSRKNLVFINDVPIQVKTSSLWRQKGKSSAYRFQQIRNDDCEIIICFGLSPNSAHCWVIEKSSFIDSNGDWVEGKIDEQHDENSRWLTVKPDSVPAWLQSLGGDLDKALNVLIETLRKDL